MSRTLKEWSLTEAARLLDQPQHRLIYLCETGVVSPDLQDAAGRGSSRRFSARNLLEFAVALRLRDVGMPASFMEPTIRVLRTFERAIAAKTPSFRLPDSLRRDQAPDVRILISDGSRLFIGLCGTEDLQWKIYGGLDLKELVGKRRGPMALQDELVRSARLDGFVTLGVFGGPEGSRHVRTEVSVTSIAQDLRLEE